MWGGNALGTVMFLTGFKPHASPGLFLHTCCALNKRVMSQQAYPDHNDRYSVLEATLSPTWMKQSTSQNHREYHVKVGQTEVGSNSQIYICTETELRSNWKIYVGEMFIVWHTMELLNNFVCFNNSLKTEITMFTERFESQKHAIVCCPSATVISWNICINIAHRKMSFHHPFAR